mmetsp:Transcript_33850/g.98412  ORF Transcript_33850/g.98412 Transcript_33850/m.98412 type:complete len:94 (+) Transcript_33850:106-387(+)
MKPEGGPELPGPRVDEAAEECIKPGGGPKPPGPRFEKKKSEGAMKPEGGPMLPGPRELAAVRSLPKVVPGTAQKRLTPAGVFHSLLQWWLHLW